MDVHLDLHKQPSNGLKGEHTNTDMTSYYRDATRSSQSWMGGVRQRLLYAVS
jgi:hypothetical protein